MPRFLLSVIDRETGTATAAELAAIDAFNERLVSGGHWVLAGGLESPDRAFIADSRGTVPTVTAGPLHGSDEYVSGFWIVEAPDAQVARVLAVEASRHCNRRVEVRAFLGSDSEKMGS